MWRDKNDRMRMKECGEMRMKGCGERRIMGVVR